MNFTVESREKTGKEFNRKLRQSGKAPGIIYGLNEPQPVTMQSEKALRFIMSMQGAKKVINLSIDSDGKVEEKKVLLQDYQLSNYGRKLIHADFLEVTDNTLVTLEVPINVINEETSAAVKTGGVIQVIRRSVPIKCAVKDIPEFIEVDVEALEFGEVIHVLDLKYPEGVDPIVTGRNFTIITVAGRVADEEEELEGEEGAEETAEGEEQPKAEEADSE